MTKTDTSRRRLAALKDQLEAIIAKDPEQEVWATAAPVIYEVIKEAKAVLPNDAVIDSISEMVTPAGAIEGEPPHRGVDVLLVVTTLLASFPPAISEARRRLDSPNDRASNRRTRPTF